MKKIVVVLILVGLGMAVISNEISKNWGIGIDWHPLTSNSSLMSYGIDYRLTDKIWLGACIDVYQAQEKIPNTVFYDFTTKVTPGFKFRFEF